MTSANQAGEDGASFSGDATGGNANRQPAVKIVHIPPDPMCGAC